MTYGHVRTLLLICIVAGVALAVHAPVLRYPFIQDDWGYLYRTLNTDTVRLLWREFSPFAKEFYRPIWPLYFLLVGKVFAFNPIPAHAIALTLHVASSLMVVRVLARLTGDALIGWLSGILYASMSFVHMEPLLWAAGIFENASVLLALVSIWCFLEGHTGRAAVAYAAGLLFKESVAFLPLLFVAIARFDRIPDLSAPPMTGRFRRFIPILLVMTAYVAIKLAGTALALPQDHPYAIRLAGSHVLRNIVIYGSWGVEALSPSAPIPVPAAGAVLMILAAALVTGTTIRKRVIPLTIWLLGAMSIYMFLPNHRYRYYMTAGLPALIGLLLLGLRTVGDLIRLPRRASAVIMIALTSASVVSSFEYFRQIDRRGVLQPHLKGTNDLVSRGATVLAVRDGLLRAYPTLPPGTVLLFKGAEIGALDHHSAPRVWYRDPTIRVYDATDLFEESGQRFLHRPTRGPGEASVAGSPRRIALGESPVFLFELTEEGLVERPVASQLRENAIARLYSAYFVRPPDQTGLRQWIARHKAGMSLASIADALAESSEFQTAYGSLSNEQFVTLAYRNVFGRNPDAVALASWVDRLDRKALTHGEVMLELSGSVDLRSRGG